MKTKIIIIGTGNRGIGCFAKGICGFETKGLPEFRERAELAALVDTNLVRGTAAAKELGEFTPPVFRDIREAQKAVRADWCIVTTPDHTHCEVVTNALEAGLNVMVDKPLATSAWECDKVIDVMEKTGKELCVGHNFRYQGHTIKAAEMVRDGCIGDVLTVEAAEILDYSHGGDYFHRWHSDFSKSAGLMNHKCCHHLDIINWIIDDDPVAVSAKGARRFYRERSDLDHGERCSECGITDTCPHYYNIDKWDGIHRRIYKEAEHEDGYIRDRCVFSDRHTINDHEVLNIEYSRGILANFTLVTFAPREFNYFYLTGTRGRIELGSQSWDGKPYLRLIRPDATSEEMTFSREHGEHGHGGADIKLIADILGMEGSLPMQRAEPGEARRAVLIADMAARSIADNSRRVRASETGNDYPPAPPQPE